MTIPPELHDSHDLRLSTWGPYTNRYMGISHIPDVRAGLRFDVSVFPGLYRRGIQPPNCFEHFIAQTGRGAGWHHFGGLSAPVLCWYGAYHRPGRLTVGLDTWIEALDVAEDHRALAAELRLFGSPHHTPVVIATLDAGVAHSVTWNDAPLARHVRHPGTLEITLPPGDTAGTLCISRRI